MKSVQIRHLRVLVAFLGLVSAPEIGAAQSSSQPTRVSVPPRITKPKQEEAAKPPAQQPVEPLASPAGVPKKPSDAKPAGGPESGGVRGAAPLGVVFESEPVYIDSMGLSLSLPPGTMIESNRGVETEAGGARTTRLRLTAPDNKWLINVHTPRTGNPDASTADVTEASLERLLAPVGSGESPRVPELVERTDTLLVCDRPAERFYVAVPRLVEKGRVIQGVTVFKLQPSQFAVFELVTAEEEFEASRRVYETIVAAVKFQDPGEAALERKTLIDAGVKLMRSVTDSEIEAIIAAMPERWERLYLPSETGAEADEREIGYRRVRLSKGTRGELSAKGVTSGASQDMGYIVRIDARFLDGPARVDMVSQFWMSKDRKSEVWTVDTARRQGDALQSFTETGGREGQMMQVRIDGGGGGLMRPYVGEVGYVSRVEQFLLPQIIARSKVLADFGFYAYQSGADRAQIRRDSASAVPDRDDLVRITTRMTSGAPTHSGLYKTTGELIRVEMPDATRWEPVEFNKLVRLWREKRLPMD